MSLVTHIDIDNVITKTDFNECNICKEVKRKVKILIRFICYLAMNIIRDK